MTPSLLFHNRHDGTFEERGTRRLEWHSILMAPCRRAWVSRWPITMATGFSISQRPISQEI